MVRPIDVAGGTPEIAWRDWTAPALTLDVDTAPLVVAPHPDDEILGVAGTMALLGRADLVAVTDGENSHPKSRAYTPEKLAAVRRAETEEALRLLGLAQTSVHRVGQPDGGIDEDAVVEALLPLLTPSRWCFATWREDGHPDHEAVGRAAARACAATGAWLLEYPIWMWHWAQPGEPGVPWDRAYRIDLDHHAREAKAAAMAAFTSQIAALGPEPEDAAILPPNVLAHFVRPYEVVFG